MTRTTLLLAALLLAGCDNKPAPTPGPLAPPPSVGGLDASALMAQDRAAVQKFWAAAPVTLKVRPLVVKYGTAAEMNAAMGKPGAWVEVYRWEGVLLKRGLGGQVAPAFGHAAMHRAWRERLTVAQRARWEAFWRKNLKQMPRAYAQSTAEEGFCDVGMLTYLAGKSEWHKPATAAQKAEVRALLEPGKIGLNLLPRPLPFRLPLLFPRHRVSPIRQANKEFLKRAVLFGADGVLQVAVVRLRDLHGDADQFFGHGHRL